MNAPAERPSLRLTTPMLESVVDGLRGVVALASDEERRESWFRYAERTLAQLQDELDSRGDAHRQCPRVEPGLRLVIGVELLDGRKAELWYEAHMWAGERSEPSNGFRGGPELDHLELKRVVVGDVGIPSEAWASLVPLDADAMADDAAELLMDELVEEFRGAR